jgi:hypothetical protein
MLLPSFNSGRQLNRNDGQARPNSSVAGRQAERAPIIRGAWLAGDVTDSHDAIER